MSETLFDRLGQWSQASLQLSGDDALNAVVDAFYSKVLEDPRLVPFFEGADIAALKRHQFNFMRFAFSEGRVGSYSGRNMRQAHERLMREKGLTGTHFDYVAEDLVGTLQQFKVPQDIIDGVVAAVSPLRVHFEPAA